jgi:hypothetical protein
MLQRDERKSRLGLTDLSALTYQRGAGRICISDEIVTLTLGKSDGQSYSDVQVDDYHIDGLMHWQPPVQMRVRARFSHPQALLRGTAGFGFWNDPFGMTKIKTGISWLPRLRLPQAIWYFFASQPSDMQLALDVAGFGWKAATIDARNVLAKILLPITPLGMLACRWRWGYRRLWPLAQRVLKIDEAVLSVAMDGWHEYQIEWDHNGVRFVVDGSEVLRTRYSHRGPLGFVVWVDNQYMVATPQGRLRSGMIATNEQQWMEIASLEVCAG